jgi:hypothetical protein
MRRSITRIDEKERPNGKRWAVVYYTNLAGQLSRKTFENVDALAAYQLFLEHDKRLDISAATKLRRLNQPKG